MRPLDHQVVAWQGIAVAPGTPFPEAGTEFQDKGFVSTSLDKEWSQAYADTGVKIAASLFGQEKEAQLRQVILPAGTMVLTASAYAKELVVARGSMFMAKHGNTVIVLESPAAGQIAEPEAVAPEPVHSAPESAAAGPDIPVIPEPEAAQPEAEPAPAEHDIQQLKQLLINGAVKPSTRGRGREGER